MLRLFLEVRVYSATSKFHRHCFIQETAASCILSLPPTRASGVVWREQRGRSSRCSCARAQTDLLLPPRPSSKAELAARVLESAWRNAKDFCSFGLSEQEKRTAKGRRVTALITFRTGQTLLHCFKKTSRMPNARTGCYRFKQDEAHLIVSMLRTRVSPLSDTEWLRRRTVTDDFALVSAVSFASVWFGQNVIASSCTSAFTSRAGSAGGIRSVGALRASASRAAARMLSSTVPSVGSRSGPDVAAPWRCRGVWGVGASSAFRAVKLTDPPPWMSRSAVTSARCASRVSINVKASPPALVRS